MDRKRLLKRTMALGGPVVVVTLIACSTIVPVKAQGWYLSRWGPADQRGAANRMTPAKTLEAKDQIKQGDDVSEEVGAAPSDDN